MPEHLDIVRAMYDAWKSGDFSAGAGDLDEHVVFVVRPSFPEAGVYQGSAGVGDYMRHFLSMWDRYTVEAEEFQEAGDTVVVRIHQRGIGKTSGVAADGRFFMLFTFRGHKIVRIESVLSYEEALEAAGLSE